MVAVNVRADVDGRCTMFFLIVVDQDTSVISGDVFNSFDFQQLCDFHLSLYRIPTASRHDRAPQGSSCQQQLLLQSWS